MTAIVEYRTASRLQPNFADAHNRIAWALVKKPDCSAQERSEALEHARRAVALGPEDGAFRTTLALAEYRAGHWAESIAAAERSIALTKGVDASNWFILAMALWQKGDKDEARKWFDKAVRVDQGEGPQERGAAPVLGGSGRVAGSARTWPFALRTLAGSASSNQNPELCIRRPEV